MRLNKHIFLGLVVVAYTVAFSATFSAINYSILIMSVALTSLYSWFYGIRIGLISIILFILLNATILYFVSGKTYDILMACEPLGTILAIIIVLVTGSVRESCDKLNNLRITLASRIDDATAELSELAEQLIGNDESARIQIGQDLHDGVGQYLTGMLLYSEALAEQLTKHHQQEAIQATQLTRLVQDNILLIRKFARSLLPIHIESSGFNAAIGEMIEFLQETTDTIFTFEANDTYENLPKTTALHLYRIAQEAIYSLSKQCSPNNISLDFHLQTQHASLVINCDEQLSKEFNYHELESRIMKYRVRAINGHLTFNDMQPGQFRMKCTLKIGSEDT